PARLSAAETKNIERASRDTFAALGCRDVARVDLRMNAAGQGFVLRAHPLAGLPPGFSDFVLVFQAAGLDYPTVIAEILAGGLKRLREKRREDRPGGKPALMDAKPTPPHEAAP